MKSYNYVLLFALFSVSIFLISVSLTFDANTGNEKFDEKLNEINKEALADISAFKAAIVGEYHVDETEVSSLISIMEPAEILLSFELSRLTSKTLSEVLTSYNNNKEEGWKKIFLSLGINKKSSRFNDLCKIEINDQNQHNSLSKK
ncbi:MAG: hypothetical protein K0R65_1302 [Crocinitomicaceae bacterium]|jgi:hypothetical protein|nr:hypothetical protein [Crocinitomicaceae bacterium]